MVLWLLTTAETGFLVDQSGLPKWLTNFRARTKVTKRSGQKQIFRTVFSIVRTYFFTGRRRCELCNFFTISVSGGNLYIYRKLPRSVVPPEACGATARRSVSRAFRPLFSARSSRGGAEPAGEAHCIRLFAARAARCRRGRKAAHPEAALAAGRPARPNGRSGRCQRPAPGDRPAMSGARPRNPAERAMQNAPPPGDRPAMGGAHPETRRSGRNGEIPETPASTLRRALPGRNPARNDHSRRYIFEPKFHRGRHSVNLLPTPHNKSSPNIAFQ